MGRPSLNFLTMSPELLSWSDPVVVMGWGTVLHLGTGSSESVDDD